MKSLDVLVAKAEGRLVTKDEPGWPKGDLKRLRAEFGGEPVVRWYGSKGEIGGWEPLSNQGSPSTDWAVGGPIIAREKIMIQPLLELGVWYGDWRAVVMSWEGRRHSEGFGKTPLIAAMRAFVGSIPK